MSRGAISRREREYDYFRGLFEQPRAGGPPLEGYARLSVPEVVRRAKELPRQAVRQIRDYEGAHRGRKTLLRELDRLLGLR